MALINTLRNRAGKFVVFMVAAAIVSFTLNDLFGSGSSFLMGENNVGKINGQSISLGEYQQELQNQENAFRLYANRNPSENDKFTINDQTWRWLISNYAYSEQYEKLGLNVSRDEIWDMLQGNNIDPTIRSFFTNQATGEFDRESFNSFMSSPASRDPQSQFIWSVVFRSLGPSRERLKYENLVINSTYATAAEGKFAYHAQSDVADVEYIYVPYYSMSDTAVDAQVTESMVKEYYKNNKEKFKIEQQRSIEYGTFKVGASKEDSTEIRTEMEELKKDFISSKNDSSFAYINTEESSIPFGRYHHGIMPSKLKDQLDSLTENTVYGPYMDNGIYAMYKVGKIYTDSVKWARGRHIFFRASTDEEKALVRDEAQAVLQEIKDGANFALKANQHSDDQQSAQMAGDLGWVPSNANVPGQENLIEAITGATSALLVPEVVETDLGLHIVEVTEPATSKMYEIATVSRTFSPSNYTVDDIFRKADNFQSSVSDIESFRSAANEAGYAVLSENDLTLMERFVGNLGNARGIVQWAFRDGEVGKVSDIFDIDDSYVVAVVTAKNEEGYQDLNAKTFRGAVEVFPVKEKIKVELRKKLKAEKIIAALNSHTGSLNEIAEAYGEGASVYTAPNLKLESNSIPSPGFDPVAVGKFFSLKDGETSAPFRTDNGVYIAKLNNKTIAPEVADYAAFTLSVETVVKNAISDSKIDNLIRKNANIEDKRYLVY